MARIRVSFDSNVFISFLLSASGASSVIQSLFKRASLLDFELVVPEAVRLEVLATVANKPALSKRISEADIQQFESFLQSVASVTPLRQLTIPSIVRDSKDDLIIAYALDAEVDYSASVDKDLLVLGDTIAPLKIRSPQAFLDDVERESGAGMG